MKINTELITDYLNKQCDKKTKEKVEQWLDEDPANREYYEELKLYWESEAVISDEIVFDEDKAFNELSKKRGKQNRLTIRRFIQYAAAIVILIASGITAYLYINPVSNQVLVENNESQEKMLRMPDGSTILLARGSSVEYSKHFSEKTRSIQLRGTAFFDITKDKNRPFIITTSRTQTVVLGTSFRISEQIGKTSIEVESGVVEFMEIDDPKNKVRLEKGDMAKFVDKQHVVLKGNEKLQNANFKIQHLAYQNQNLASICKDLSELFHSDIRLEGDRTTHLTLTAIFEDQTLDNILETISFSLDLEIEKQDKYILLK
jgi:ferric-dicitrate binding protein FerR (iron transport regulator)